ncbi:beta strand repeat-containing protein, partial [Massilia niastensis]|uniref:beta strand repeat-containing protein n=1 Tax=Massilia niastensis TaxID=544911 RepID=UPI0004764538
MTAPALNTAANPVPDNATALALSAPSDTLSATQTATLAPGGDVDSDGAIDPGDTVVVTVAVTNDSTSTSADNVTLDQALDGLTGSAAVNVSPVAVGESYTVAGNTVLQAGGGAVTGPAVKAANGVLANDREFNGDSYALAKVQGADFVAGATYATAQGKVTMNADGSFSYKPATGYTGYDSFTYTIRDGGIDNIAGNADDLSSTAKVEINVTGKVWYVDGSAAAGGDGSSDNPFNTTSALNGAGDVDGAGDTIYVKNNASGALTLEANQHLVGSGAALVVEGMTLADATGARSTLAATSGTTVTLATGNEIAGITIGGSATGIAGANFGTLTVRDSAIDTAGQALSLSTGSFAGTGFVRTDSDGGTNNVSLNAVAGTVNLGTGALSGATGASVVVTGGTGSVDYNGTVTHTGNAAAISVSGKTGGSVDFDGAVSASASSDGISLANNTGAVINFDGGLALNTSASNTTAFSATGGGTVSVTGANNTIVSGAGTALNVQNTNIGAADLSFKSISSNGATVGIRLDSTGNFGNLNVTGDGSNTNNDSGGTIANSTDTGIVLNATRDVVLNQMEVTGSLNDGIRGTNLVNLTLNRLDITNNGDAGRDAGVQLGDAYPDSMANGATGTINVTNLRVSGSGEDNFNLWNNAGTATVNISNSSFGNNSFGWGNDGVRVESYGSADVYANITSNTFTANRGDHFQAAAGTSNGASGNLHVTFTGNTLTGGHAQGLGQGITVSAGGGINPAFWSGRLDYNISNNTINGAVGTAITAGLSSSTAGAVVNGSIQNNTIGTTGVTDSGSKQSSGIVLGSSGAGTHTALVSNNQVREVANRGVSVTATDGIGVTNLTLKDNNIAVTSALGTDAVYVQAGATSNNILGQVDSSVIRLDASGNTLSAPTGYNEIYLRQRFDTRIELEGYTGAGNDQAAILAYLNSKNTGTESRVVLTSYPSAPAAEGVYGAAADVPLPTAFVTAGAAAAPASAQPPAQPADPVSTPAAPPAAPSGSASATDTSVSTGGPMNLGTLAPGQTVVVQTIATVDSQTGQLLVNPSSSSTVTSNFGSVTASTTVPLDALELGGRVVNDIDHDDVAGAGDSGISGVTVRLLAADGVTVLATTTTAAGGVYKFAGLAPGDYIVQVAESNFAPGAPLYQLISVPGNPDPDGAPDVAGDDNGAPSAGQGLVSLPVTLAYDSETTQDASGKYDINDRLDFIVRNEPPVIGNLSGDSATFIEGGAAVLLDSGAAASLTDLNNAILHGGVLHVAVTNRVPGEDVLGIRSTGAVALPSGLTVGSAVTVDGVPIGMIALDGSGGDLIVFLTNATPAQVTSLLGALTYANANTATPAHGTRTVTVTISDSMGGSDMAATTVEVRSVNDAPVVDLVGATLAYSEGTAATPIAPAATIADIDSGDFAGGSLVVSFSANGTAADQLTITHTGTGAGQIGVSGSNVTYGNTVIGAFSGGDNGAPLTIAFSAGASAAAVQQLVREIAYANTSASPSTAARTVAFTLVDGDGVADGGLDTGSATATIGVTAVNSAPAGSVGITGLAAQGETLSASHTLLDGDGIGAIGWQWQADGSDIAGATGSTLVLAQEQVGKAITVVARYTDAGGTAERVDSGATALVANVNDAPSGSVTISGSVVENQTLTASAALSDLDGMGTIGWQWQADGVDIPGATGSTLLLTQDHVGKPITVVASYLDGASAAESVSSSATAAVLNFNNLPTGQVSISGAAQQGQTLTAAHTLLDADGLGAIGWQWQADGVDIAGATGATLVLGQEQVGKAITVLAHYTDAGDTAESVSSSATALVANVNDAPGGSVTITGTAAQGQTLSAQHTLSDLDGLGTVGWQWQADGVDIAGATGSTLVLTQEQVGKSITVVARYTDVGDTAEAVPSIPTSAVANVNDTPGGSVTITGTAQQGQTLTA